MKAILLAAGLGSRLGGITARLPKCMVEIEGTPVLWRNLEWATANGISEVAVNLHHHPEVVTSYFGDRRPPLPIQWSYEPQLLGTAGTVHSLTWWLEDEPFVVLYADNLIGCDLRRVRETHECLRAKTTVALFERPDVCQSGVAEMDGAGRIVRFVEKPHPGTSESHWVNAGLLIVDPDIAQIAPSPGDIGHDLLPAMISKGLTVAGYRMGPDESLHWIDTPIDLERTRAVYAGAAP